MSLGLIACSNLRRLLPGLSEHGVDFRLRVRLDSLGDFFDSVHHELPFPRGQALILMIISMEASRDKIA